MANEKRLIDANALSDSKWWESLTDDFDKARARIIVMSAPTVDAVEVVHGRWKKYMEEMEDFYGKPVLVHTGFSCSVCTEYLGFEGNYCPNCGAKMDGDGDG